MGRLGVALVEMQHEMRGTVVWSGEASEVSATPDLQTASSWELELEVRGRVQLVAISRKVLPDGLKTAVLIQG